EPLDQEIVLPFLSSLPTRPSSPQPPYPLSTTNFLASVRRAVASSPSSLTSNKMRPCWKMAQGWSSSPSESHSPGNLLVLSRSAADAISPSASSPPAAATVFSKSRRRGFSVIGHLLSRES